MEGDASFLVMRRALPHERPSISFDQWHYIAKRWRQQSWGWGGKYSSHPAASFRNCADGYSKEPDDLFVLYMCKTSQACTYLYIFPPSSSHVMFMQVRYKGYRCGYKQLTSSYILFLLSMMLFIVMGKCERISCTMLSKLLRFVQFTFRHLDLSVSGCRMFAYSLST